MENKELYKLFQLSDIFVSKYEYTQVVLKQYQELSSNEAWLFNSQNKNYQVVRITYNSANHFTYDEARVEEYLTFFKSNIKKSSINFLDIHISNEPYDKENEQYDYLNIEENYADGCDVKDIYPEIYTAIHKVEDPNKEISNIVKRMKLSIKNKIKSRNKLNRFSYIATYIIIAICVINYLFGLYLKTKYSDTSSIFVVLGADYKTFTLGLKQYYRLITYAFVHNDIIHLLCNMYSLYSIGRYVEAKYGHTKYLLILFLSIIIGSLTQGILSDNGICIGISAGIYGLLVVFIIDIVSSKVIDLRQLMPMICINLFLNFLSTTAWMAHLGGAIGGLAIYYLLQEPKQIQRILLCVVLLLSLTIKYVTIDSIKSLYIGTDLQVVDIYKDLNLNSYANKLVEKLFNFYSKLGG